MASSLLSLSYGTEYSTTEAHVSQRDNLIQRLRARPAQAAFSDVRKLLELFGYSEAGRDGSHVRFKKLGERSLIVTAVSGRWVKRYKIIEVCCERLGLDE